MKKYYRWRNIVIIISLIIIMGIVTPLVWPNIIAQINFINVSALWGGIKSVQNNNIDTLLAIVLGIFTTSTAFFIFLLEISTQRHREYSRKELVGKIPDVILILQIILFIAALFCFLGENVKGLNRLLWWLFVFSIAMISIAVLCTTSCIDLFILYRMKYIFNKIKRINEIPISYEKKIHEMMRKLAYDTGRQFAANVAQDLDKFQIIIINDLVAIAHDLSKEQTRSFLYTIFHQITLYLIRGFKESRTQRDEININLLVNMFIDFFTSIMIELFDVKTDSKRSIENESDNLLNLTILSGIMCCAFENLDNEEAERLFTGILNYRNENMNGFARTDQVIEIFQRLFVLLYARGYYLVIHNKVNDTNRPNWFFNILYNSINELSKHSDDDIYLFWNIWAKADKLSLHASATYIMQLLKALKAKYLRVDQQYKGDLVYILLFGIRTKELIL